MRSLEKRVRMLGAACLVAWLACAPIERTEAQSEPSDAEIDRALAELRADRNLTQERKTQTLKWKSSNTPRERARPTSFSRWVKDFFTWLGQVSRVVVWVIGAVLVAMVTPSIVRMFRNAAMSDDDRLPQLPTHVRDLDIRPESLPHDIGAAAFALWHEGQRRAALALLYRGALSRLVHQHRLSIGDASTEGDVLSIANQHLAGLPRDYVARLVGIWQRAVYGGYEPDGVDVQALCSEFSAALGQGSAP